MCLFFFSISRRHTRLQGDWSSDVCSSDLRTSDPLTAHRPPPPRVSNYTPDGPLREPRMIRHLLVAGLSAGLLRSEERRVGKECTSRVLAGQSYKKASTPRRDPT